jgi:hypothetical protein
VCTHYAKHSAADAGDDVDGLEEFAEVDSSLRPTKVTFRNGTVDVRPGRKRSVIVKFHDRKCVTYNTTYAPQFDCVSACSSAFTPPCRKALPVACGELCKGFHHPTCVSKRHLFKYKSKVSHGNGAPADSAAARSAAGGFVVGVLSAVVSALLLLSL